MQVESVPHAIEIHKNTLNKWENKSKKTEYGANLGFRDRTKEIFYWDTEDGPIGLIDPDTGIHPEFAAYFPGFFLEEDTPVPVAAVETKILDPKAIAAAAADKSGIKNTIGFYDVSDSPTPIFTIKPTPDAEPDNEHEEI